MTAKKATPKKAAKKKPTKPATINVLVRLDGDSPFYVGEQINNKEVLVGDSLFRIMDETVIVPDNKKNRTNALAYNKLFEKYDALLDKMVEQINSWAR